MDEALRAATVHIVVEGVQLTFGVMEFADKLATDRQGKHNALHLVLKVAENKLTNILIL